MREAYSGGAAGVIEAVKGRMGDRLAIQVRVPGEEYGQEGGLTQPEATEAVVLFERAGADVIHVAGWGRNTFDSFTDGPLPNKAPCVTRPPPPWTALRRSRPAIVQRASPCRPHGWRRAGCVPGLRSVEDEDGPAGLRLQPSGTRSACGESDSGKKSRMFLVVSTT